MSLIKSEKIKNISALLLGIFLSILILEVFLRFYNPFGFRVRGESIILYPYKKYEIENKTLKNADKFIKHSKNSIGFRGEDPPADFANSLTIVAVGGSTTEGFYLNNKDTWPEKLEFRLKEKFKNIWVNNAGFDGQSSYGHKVLLKDYLIKLKPKIVIFYCGLNDMGLSAMNDYDGSMFKKSGSISKRILKFSVDKSALAANVLNFYLYFVGKKAGVTHGNIDFSLKEKQLSLDKEKEILNSEIKNIKEYKERLIEIADIAKENSIEPIFVSQAALCDSGKDIFTGREMGSMPVFNKYRNCRVFGKVLRLYNSAMKEAALEKGVYFIDARALMPLNSLFYYDLFHFTPKGADMFAEKIEADISRHLKKEYNGFYGNN